MSAHILLFLILLHAWICLTNLLTSYHELNPCYKVKKRIKYRRDIATHRFHVLGRCIATKLTEILCDRFPRYSFQIGFLLYARNQVANGGVVAGSRRCERTASNAAEKDHSNVFQGEWGLNRYFRYASKSYASLLISRYWFNPLIVPDHVDRRIARGARRRWTHLSIQYHCIRGNFYPWYYKFSITVCKSIIPWELAWTVRGMIRQAMSVLQILFEVFLAAEIAVCRYIMNFVI